MRNVRILCVLKVKLVTFSLSLEIVRINNLVTNHWIIRMKRRKNLRSHFLSSDIDNLLTLG